MCGIFGVSGDLTHDAGKTALEGIKKLEYRGYDSWGVAIDGQNGIEVYKQVGKISEANISFPSASKAIGHSRWATHGGVTQENAHPHSYKTVTLVHNGIFENFSAEKQKLIAKGHQFSSDTDTEVIAHLLYEFLEQGFSSKEAVQKVCACIHGRFSLLLMIEGEDGLIAARRGSPLIIGRTENCTYIASDIPAFLEYTRTVNYLDDDEIAIIRHGQVDFFDMTSGESLEKRNIEVSWKDEVADKGDYDHFMIKEIFDQKSSIASAINHSDEEIAEFIEAMHHGNGVYMIACGTAHKASMAAEYYFASLAKKKINVVSASEMPAFYDFLSSKTVLFAVSQSGETADILEVLEEGKRRGAKILSITNVESSSIARISDHHLPLRAGKEKAVASTKATTAQMAILLLLAYAYGGKLNEGRQVLYALSSNVNEWLNPRYEEHVKKVAEGLSDIKNIFIIGRNAMFPMALESAIKIMEVSYIHAQGFAAGEMKHGPIALIEKGTPCIVLGGGAETISNAIELKSRGAHIIGVSPERSDIFDDWLRVPEAFEVQSIASILPVQILAYYLATLRGLDPDMPRNLAKSVTVK